MRIIRWILTFLFLIFTMHPTVAWERCQDCERDSHGKIKRSRVEVSHFKKAHPCPVGGTKTSCPGYIVDHIIPLQCGGLDAPENMAWQTKTDAHAKDLWEGECEIFQGVLSGLTLKQAERLHHKAHE